MNGYTYYDELPCTGRKCVYLDSGRDYRTDHFYSWESFFGGFSRSLYVRSRDLILHSYQKLLILICMLLFCFPAFAEDEAYNFQNIGNEALALQGYDVNQMLYDDVINDQNDIIQHVLSEPLSNLAIEGNTFTVDKIGTYYRAASGSYGIRIYGTGEPYLTPQGLSIFVNDQLLRSSQSVNDGYANIASTFLPGDPLNIVYVKSNLNEEIIPLNITVQVPFENDLDSEESIFLINIKYVFTWLLTNIGLFITFILANAFLSVSLLLFMCGVVVSFFVRVKRS